MVSNSISTAAAPRFRSAPAATRCEREWEPEPATQRDLHCLRGERGVGVAWDGLEPCSGMRTGLGAMAARKAAARGRGRNGSVCATHSVASHASIHRSRRSLEVGQAGGLPAPRAPRKARRSSLQPQAACGPTSVSEAADRPIRKGRAPFAEHGEGIGPARPVSRWAGARGLRQSQSAKAGGRRAMSRAGHASSSAVAPKQACRVPHTAASCAAVYGARRSGGTVRSAWLARGAVRLSRPHRPRSAAAVASAAAWAAERTKPSMSTAGLPLLPLPRTKCLPLFLPLPLPLPSLPGALHGLRLPLRLPSRRPRAGGSPRAMASSASATPWSSGLVAALCHGGSARPCTIAWIRRK